jgi:RHH-type transcriptional regulator, rel operon repressor / antitoxin RelB
MSPVVELGLLARVSRSAAAKLCTMCTYADRPLLGSPMSPSETITIRLSADLKGKLESLATSTHRSKSWLAAQAIATYVEAQAWQVEQIEAAVALADSDQAVWVEAAEVDVWLSTWGTDRETPTPCG